jgi:hypothetical protein
MTKILLIQGANLTPLRFGAAPRFTPFLALRAPIIFRCPKYAVPQSSWHQFSHASPDASNITYSFLGSNSSAGSLYLPELAFCSCLCLHNGNGGRDKAIGGSSLFSRLPSDGLLLM